MTQLKSNVAAALKAIVCGVAIFITALIASVSPVTADTVAFTAPTGLITDVEPYNPVNLGDFFTPNANISVDSLGIYYQPQLFASSITRSFSTRSAILHGPKDDFKHPSETNRSILFALGRLFKILGRCFSCLGSY